MLGQRSYKFSIFEQCIFVIDILYVVV